MSEPKCMKCGSGHVVGNAELITASETGNPHDPVHNANLITAIEAVSGCR